MSEIVVVGANHNTSPLDVREKLAFDNSKLNKYLLELKALDGLDEVMIISTCNRVEVLYVSKADIVGRVLEYLSHHSGIELEKLKGYLYIKKDTEAVRHVFRVASSLDSMVVGEPQILGQIKEAYKWSVEFYTSGATINRIMRRAFHAAKIVKAKTDISKGAISIAYAGFLKVRELMDVEGKNVLSIGNSEMNRLSCEHFFEHGAVIKAIANRTVENVLDLAEKYNAQVFGLDRLKDAFRGIDIVVTSTASNEPIIKPEFIPKDRKIVIVDLAVPQDTDRSVERLDNVKLIRIDDLRSIVDQSLEYRKKQAELAERIIDEEIEAYKEYVKSLDYDEVIKEIRLRAERIRKLEIYKFKKIYKNRVDDGLLEGIDKLTKSLLSKILHEPTMNIKGFLNHPEGDLYIELLKRLFNISTSKKDVRCFFSENN